MNVFLLEDDEAIGIGLKYSLENEGYTVTIATSVKSAFEIINKEKFVLYILDLTLPDGSGYDVCKKIKSIGDFPVIFLTAYDDEVNVVMGLELGADDYITKPFNILELKARIKAILRRSVRVVTHEESKSNIIKSRDLEIDLESRRCFIKGKEKNLTAKEFDLLELLAVNPGKVYSRDNLLKAVWGQDYSGDGRTVDVHMRRLREKIEDNPSEPKYVHTKWGVGYYFNV